MTEFNPSASLADREAAYRQLVKELSADKQPIVLGPWRSELGFEVSYWIPFLRRLAQQVPDFASRAVVLTRGGAAVLYEGIAKPCADLYQLRSVTELRRENLYDHQVTHKGQTQKQLSPTRWDEAAIEDMVDACHVKMPYHTVHPAWMYWLLSPYWSEEVGLRALNALCQFEGKIPAPPLPQNCPLPPKYAAVKFYGRHTLPMHDPSVRETVKQIVSTLAAQMPVVVLGSGGDFDDHMDGRFEGANIVTVTPDQPEFNVAVQAAIVAHAACFVGTYGGTAQMALAMGIPSASFYTEWGGTAHAHFALSSWLSKVSKVPFVVGSLNDVSLWRQMTSVPANLLTVKPDAVAL